MPGHTGKKYTRGGSTASFTAAMGPPGCDLQMDAHHVSLSGLNTLRSTLALLPLARGILGIRHRTSEVARSLDGFDAAGGQRKVLLPVCWVGSPTQRVIRCLTCRWRSSTARTRLEFSVRAHTTLVGQGSECSTCCCCQATRFIETGGRRRASRKNTLVGARPLRSPLQWDPG